MADANTGYICDEISEQIIQIAAKLTHDEGAHQVNVRKIIHALGVTNRVFYNRFSNCDEVLRIVYQRAVEEMRVSFSAEYHDKESFAAFCLDAGEAVLIQTYDVKMQFSRYVFEHDSLTENNRLWWAEKVRFYYRDALERGYVRAVDEESLCCAIWCFCRGYQADAVARRLSKEEAVRNFRVGFQLLIDGVLL